MKQLWAGFLIVLASNVWADNPCAALDIAGNWFISDSTCGASEYFGGPIQKKPVHEFELLARLT